MEKIKRIFQIGIISCVILFCCGCISLVVCYENIAYQINQGASIAGNELVVLICISQVWLNTEGVW